MSSASQGKGSLQRLRRQMLAAPSIICTLVLEVLSCFRPLIAGDHIEED